MIRRWISSKDGEPITRVPPDKSVVPEMLLSDGDSAPEAVEVRRTYETVFERLLRALSGSATRRVIDLVKVEDGAGAVRFEEWPAAHFAPPLKPTELVYRDHKGNGRDHSAPLLVVPTVDISLRRPAARVTVADPTGTAPIGVEIPLLQERTITGTVQAPVDPEVELVVLSPLQGEELMSLEQYASSCLSELESDLLDDPDFEGDPEQLRSLFEEAYEPFVAGDGQIDAEIENPLRTVRPGEPEEFEVVLHPERAGAMMLMIGARVPGGELLSVSEMLPLRWDDEDKPLTADDLAADDVTVSGWRVIDEEGSDDRVRVGAPAREREVSA